VLRASCFVLRGSWARSQGGGRPGEGRKSPGGTKARVREGRVVGELATGQECLQFAVYSARLPKAG
jgi:hypothetical protein